MIAPMNLMRNGARALFRGARQGSSPLAGFGAAMLAAGWIRRISRSPRELVYTRTLRKGEALRIRLLGPDEPDESVDVVG